MYKGPPAKYTGDQDQVYRCLWRRYRAEHLAIDREKLEKIRSDFQSEDVIDEYREHIQGMFHHAGIKKAYEKMDIKKALLNIAYENELDIAYGEGLRALQAND